MNSNYKAQPSQSSAPLINNQMRVPPMSTRSSSNQSQQLQKKFAYEVEGGYVASNDACYEGMMTCFGDIIGFLGSIPCCYCCPNP